MSTLKFIISGGGTGGHIYPAIAIADELKRRHPEAEFLFVGAENRMEMQKVPQAGYKIEGLWISGIQRKISISNLLFPLKLMNSLYRSKKIIKNFKPDVAVGTGGFASGPLLKAANQKNIPTLLQEQNSYAGITNKWLAKQANTICVAYDGMEKYFPKEKIRFTGNPVRQDILHGEDKREEALSYFELDPAKKTVLVLGGSLGAQKINELIAAHLQFFQEKKVQVIWQTGNLYFERFKRHNAENNIHVHEFLNRMDLAYAAADLIISRAGAGSVSELCLVGKPVLFIPSPNVAEDHQTKNAEAFVKKKAALMLAETALEEFSEKFGGLLASEEKQFVLGQNIKKQAKPRATSEIADEVEKLIQSK